jgi:predicted nucleic acid-binding protein
MYLIDTSVWIDFLRNSSTKAAKKLGEIIEVGEIGINEVIYNEICLGAKDSNQFAKYQTYFGEIPFYTLHDWHENVAIMRFKLKRKGVTAFLADSLIAHSAISNDLILVSKDKDFSGFARHCGLKLLLV